jgi:hypothetical protein
MKRLVALLLGVATGIGLHVAIASGPQPFPVAHHQAAHVVGYPDAPVPWVHPR